MCLFLYNTASILGKYGNNYFFSFKGGMHPQRFSENFNSNPQIP